ncbi:MAG: prenyltransferase/squalene oxidase repeat-containing protein, partial [Planctomycetota bacterium]
TARAAVAPVVVAPAAVAPVAAASAPSVTAVQPLPARPTAAVQPTPIQPLPARPQPVAAAAPAPAAVRPAAPRPGPITAAAAAAPAPTAARPIPVSTTKPVIVARHQPDDETEAEEEKPIEERILKAAPPWMVSLVVHMIALVVMGLWYIASTTKQQLQIEAIYSEELGVQLQNDQLDSGLMEQIKIDDPSLSIDNVPVNDPFAAPPELPKTALDGNVATDSMVAPSIGLALSGREKGSKSQLLGKYGGNATTEAAVRLGLEWLSRQQQATGTWSLTGPYSDGAGIENRCSATAMALLAFQGAGHTHREGDFKKEVSKGWKALLGMQNKDGVFYHEGVQHQGLYAQAQATIAICELYGMTKDKDYKLPAQRAIDYAVKIQAPEGGWRYVPGQDSDTSVTGWYVIALQSALMAGLEVPSPTLEKISKYLDSVGSDNMTRYSYRPGGGATETMTAEALLCRQYLSWKQEDPRLKEGVNLLLESPIRWDFDNQNVYYWYYATQVMHHMEGDPWKRWNEVMREVIPKQQEKTGKNAGSWSPSNDRWGGPGGRLYETCLCIYMLEVYYRHLPIYKWKQH